MFIYVLSKTVQGKVRMTSLADSHDKYLLLCIQCWDCWWWTADLSETCRVLYQNKLQK